MKLSRILSIYGVLTVVDATFFRKSRPAISPRSDLRTPALSLAANLEPINTTHVNVSMTNTYSEQISILNWNNHFQTNQNAAYRSFQLTHTSSNGSIQTLGPGPDMGRFRFKEIMPSHFFNLTAGSTYIDCFDLTKLFKVPEEGAYNLTMYFTSPATLIPDGMNLSTVLADAERQKRRKHSQYLPKVRIKSDSMSMNLQASSPSYAFRKRTGMQEGCTTRPQSAAIIHKARGNARSLAKFAQAAVLPPSGISAHGVSTNRPKDPPSKDCQNSIDIFTS